MAAPTAHATMRVVFERIVANLRNAVLFAIVRDSVSDAADCLNG